MTSVEDAFRWARILASRHMAACESAFLQWGETTITEIVLARAAAAVTVVPFTQPAEALGGADWIWWWVDTRGAYGMLVQAKRVTVSPRKWVFDFGYPKGTGRQRARLMSTAAAMNLLPVYSIYLGTGDYRGWEPCSDDHRSGRCLQCVKRSVSLMPAILADEGLATGSEWTYQRSVALEDLWTTSTRGVSLIPALRKQLSPELADFLKTKQRGVRAVTRSMIDRVLTVRVEQFAAVTPPADSEVAEGSHDDLGPIFSETPTDAGHWGVDDFKHVLDPLRPAPPSYVLEIDSGDFNADDWVSDMPGNVAGVVVVRIPQNL